VRSQKKKYRKETEIDEKENFLLTTSKNKYDLAQYTQTLRNLVAFYNISKLYGGIILVSQQKHSTRP